VPERPHPDGWSRCLPSENRAKGAGEWNHYIVEANDGVIKLNVNGKVVSSVSKCSPRKGYLALESEGSECHFKNLKIKELPSTNPKPEEVADEAQGHKPLYTGLDLSGWKADDEAKKHWQVKDTVLHYDGKGKELRTEKEYGDVEFVVDFRLPAKDAGRCAFFLREADEERLTIWFDPDGAASVEGSKWKSGIGRGGAPLKPAGEWNRLQVSVQGKKLNNEEITVTLNGTRIDKQTMITSLPTNGTLALRPDGEMDFANLFVREVK
jgi:hypothetical protein